jgi:hypothetical protein
LSSRTICANNLVKGIMFMNLGSLAAIERASRSVNEGKLGCSRKAATGPYAVEGDSFYRLVLSSLEGARQ